MRKAFRVWTSPIGIMVLLVMFLSGCGGGGGGTASSSGEGAQANSSTSSSTTPSATPAPATPSGTGSFSGAVTTQLGIPVSGATVSAVATQGAKSVTRDVSFIQVTSTADGSFNLSGLVVGQTYSLTVSSPGNVTVQTTFQLQSAIPDLQVILPVPPGSGTVNFSLPTPLILNAPITDGTQVDLSWQQSLNPGFVAYTVFKSQSPDVTTTNTQVTVIVAANDTKTTDTLAQAGQTFYYRLYEKDLVPALGTFILMGTNIVQSSFPTITSSTPNSTGTGVTTPLQINFSAAMNESSVTLTFTTDQTGDVTTGTTNWSGNTLTFTPTPRWEYGRSYMVTVAGSDALGNQLAGNLILTFGTKSGYKIDTSFASTDLGMLSASNNNGAAVIAIDAANEVLLPGGEKFSSTGSLLGTLPIAGFGMTVDAMNDIWTVQSTANNPILTQYDINGNLLMSNTCITNVLGGVFVCVDDTRSIAYLSGTLSGNALAFSTSGGAIMNQIGVAGASFILSRAAIDSLGYIYLLQRPSTPNALNTVGKFDPSGNLVSTYTVENELGQIFQLGVAVDPHNSLYVCSQDFVSTSTSSQAVRFSVFDSTGHLFTTFTFPVSTFNNFNGQIAVDGIGNIYVVDAAYQRLIPDP